MRKILLGVILTLIVLFTLKYCDDKKEEKAVLKESSALIQEQIKNVGKLVVTEGHFSQVLNYDNSKEIFGKYFSFKKKALVIVNADVFISYDLSLIEYKIDEATKTLTIISIPKEEIRISPDLEYYDIEADFLNPFKATDHNNIRDLVKKSLIKKLDKSDMKANAQNRLISELAKFFILTNSLGWTLEYNNMPIENQDGLNMLKL
ncbi:DUF4230 domain-containing protein [Bizionia argentinensis JUB59]|uniref:DUF4230 domain-containing protein n=1 Tax=Bizionia argentinensis JUB59 TaxID=1046627 RepID=G2EA53_9FLAO|nr:DUF4230 domain-containing protein [Bizionia argentinensis]EGV44690.2 DUF4230 domain-containing protein [Bizionia argentinensis JUB59]